MLNFFFFLFNNVCKFVPVMKRTIIILSIISIIIKVMQPGWYN